MVGVSGRAILEQLVFGSPDPILMASLVKGRLEGKETELRRVLEGVARAHTRLCSRHN